MADPDFNLEILHSNFQKEYKAVMSDSGSSSNDGAQKQAIAFGQQVKQTVPSDHLNNSIPCDEGTSYNPVCDSRFRNVPITVIYSQEPHLGEPSDLPVKAKLQSPQSSDQSEIKIAKAWSTAVAKDSNSVDNSHQYSNLMEQFSQIIPAENSSNIDASQTVQTQESLVHSEAVAIRTNWEGKAHINKCVTSSSEKTTDDKAARLKRRRERQRELRKDPDYAERQKELKREWERKRCQTDPDYAERRKKRKREWQRKRYQTDPDYAERQRERKRELRKDPDYAKRLKERQMEWQRKRCQADPNYAERERERRREYQREYHRKRQTDPDYVERERERKKEYQRKRYRTDPDYAKRQRERNRELRKDPDYAERQRERRREYQRKRYQTDPDYAERKRERQRERQRERKRECQREHKKQHCQSVNSAETTQSSSKNSEGTAPGFSVVKLKEYLASRSTLLSLSERSAIEESEDTGHCPLDKQTA